MMFGPDGRLYAVEPSRKRIVSFAADGTGEQVVASAVDAGDIAVTSQGIIYFTEPALKRISVIDKDKKKRVAFQSSANEMIAMPTSLRLSPDEHLMDVADRDSRWVWTFEVAPDHSLRYGLAFHHLEFRTNPPPPTRSVCAHDNTGHVYVGTNLGIQISDPPGRVVGIIRNPEPGTATSLVFGGQGLSTLYATVGGKVYSRHMRRAGTYPGQPVKEPRPQL